MDEFKVEAGQPLSAKKWNRAMDRLLVSTAGNLASPYPLSRVEAMVKNTSGRDYDIGELMQISSFAGPTANAPYEALTNIIYDATTPTWHTAIDNIVVAAEPIPDGEQGVAVISGQCIVSTAGGTGRFLMVDPTNAYQGRLAASGIARILGSIDASWSIANLGEHQNVFRYKLTAASLAGANLLGIDGTQIAASVSVVDPLLLTKFLKLDDEGFCVLAGNTFTVLVPKPQTIQFVTDVIFGTDSITIERKNVVVFGSEDIVDEVIAAAECPTYGYS